MMIKVKAIWVHDVRVSEIGKVGGRGGGWPVLILSKDSILIVQSFPTNGVGHFWKGKANNELQHCMCGTDSNKFDRLLGED